AGLNVGERTVGDEIPLGAEPNGREVLLRPIERRSVVFKYSDHAAGFLSGAAFLQCRRTVRQRITIACRRTLCRQTRSTWIDLGIVKVSICSKGGLIGRCGRNLSIGNRG